VWLAGLWVWIWEGILANKSMEMIWEDYKNAGYYMTISILWIALVESAAIYGLIIWVQLLTTNFIDPIAAIWVGLAIWLAWLWVWIWEGKMVWKAIQAMHVNPSHRKKILTFMILFIALIESVAIYGLVVATQILQTPEISWIIAIGAWLAVGLSALWVWIWEWTLSEYSMDVIWKKSSLQGLFLTTTILWIALVESAAIYGLVISFQILWISPEIALSGLAAWLAIWLAALWAWIGEGMLVAGTFCSIYRNPTMKSRDLAFMVLFLALIEVLAIYGLIVAFQILS
jgi:F-type H+-transporting ATPase subunit c